MRGNPDVGIFAVAVSGSIPASAGEPVIAARLATENEVYPRECGGTEALDGYGGGLLGLSPRVRGNPLCAVVNTTVAGSIPASAGEPSGRNGPRKPQRVYPRECGGTANLITLDILPKGLSPRVRGNLLYTAFRAKAVRSIPASAGEPYFKLHYSVVYTVYPRECGGTYASWSLCLLGAGLSPRVRGNPEVLDWTADTPRSIPASAGEPPSWTLPARSFKVYPRECGGTPPQISCTTGYTGSIPASAGEPVCRLGGLAGRWVYPRECGGTIPPTDAGAEEEGLSPRVRGNLPG